MNYSIPSNPLILDLDYDGFIDHVYIGDVAGQLWKFNTGPTGGATLSSGLINNWTGKRFFVAPNSRSNPPSASEWTPEQAMYYPPVAGYDGSNPPKLWLYFGTGDRNHPNAAATNRFYVVVDGTPNDTTNSDNSHRRYLKESDLANVTSTNATDTDGWYFTLDSTEKVLAQAELFNNLVYFNTFTPSTTSACDQGAGTAKQYAVQMTTGYAAIKDWTNATLYTTSDPSSADKTRWTTIGSGIPSRPLVIVTDSGTSVSASVTEATTDQQLPNNPAPPPAIMRRVLYWREQF